MTFTEKSSWISFFIIALVYSQYFLYVFEGLANGSMEKVQIFGLFIGATVALIVYQTVLHVILAIFNLKQADEPSDERDRMFATKAGNISGWVLTFAVITIAVTVFIHDLNAMWSANLLILALVVSQLAEYIMTVFYYRRGY